MPGTDPAIPTVPEQSRSPLWLGGVLLLVAAMASFWFVGQLSRFGEIIVDAHGRTNLPGVFAAGDCTTVPFKQIVIAAGEGSKAALSAFDHLIRMPVVGEGTKAQATQPEAVAA